MYLEEASWSTFEPWKLTAMTDHAVWCRYYPETGAMSCPHGLTVKEYDIMRKSVEMPKKENPQYITFRNLKGEDGCVPRFDTSTESWTMIECNPIRKEMGISWLEAVGWTFVFMFCIVLLILAIKPKLGHS